MPMIPIDQIEPDPENVRRVAGGAAADAQLQASIKAVGLIQPIVVRFFRQEHEADGGRVLYRIIAGHRRFAAVKALGWTEIDCRVWRGDTAGETTLIQLTENIVRADMSPIDVFEAVERLAIEGMDDAAIAVALSQTERRVKQLRAMGSLHPAIVAYIRESGHLPDTNDMTVICQASLAQQGEAFEAAKKQAGKGHIYWWQVRAGCVVASIPLRFARFDRALYQGPIKTDLFREEVEEEASSPSLFLKLQREWLTAEVQRREQEGFHTIGAGMEYGSLKRPKECDHDWKALDGKTKLPGVKARKEWAYVYAIDDQGRVHERLWKLKAAPAKVDKAAGAAAQPGAASAEPNDKALLTQKGQELVEQAKRQAVAESVRMGLYSPDLLAVALLVLAEKLSLRRDMAQLLLRPDGAINVVDENRDHAVMNVAQHLLAEAITKPGNYCLVPMSLVERIGVGFGAQPTIKADETLVDTLKRPAVLAAGKAAHLHDMGAWKMGEIKKAVAKIAPVLTATDLPALALDAAAKLPYGWPKAGVTDDEDTAPEDGDPEAEEMEEAA